MRFFDDASGATGIDFGLLAAGVAMANIAVVGSLSSSLNTTFTSVQTALKWRRRQAARVWVAD